MKCPFCLANENKYFKEGVCRRCLSLRYGVLKQDDFDFQIKDSDYELKFELTPFQKEVAHDLRVRIRYENIFLEAVCGAGKTEMCYELIAYYLKKGYQIGWAIPRRQVVLELAHRLQNDFKGLKVIPVCEGYTDDLEGDLIICTTHQLYRYHQYFDFLIVDEPDAFPFHKNELLIGFMKQSVRSHILFMSATYDPNLTQMLKPCYHRIMPLRPSLKPLPIPNIRRSHLFFIKEYFSLRHEKLLLFVPTIRMCKWISKLLMIPQIHSKTENKDEIIQSFIDNPSGKLVSTTILERGVTFENCFVFVLMADHPVFNQASLIQMSGRVLRGFSSKGACYFYHQSKSKDVEACVHSILKMNELALTVLKS